MSRVVNSATKCTVCSVDAGNSSYRPPHLFCHASVGDFLVSRGVLSGPNVPSNPPLCAECFEFVSMGDKACELVKANVGALKRRLSASTGNDGDQGAVRVNSVPRRRGNGTSEYFE